MRPGIDDDKIPSVGTSVVIVDDHAGFRATLRRALEADGLRVCGEAADADAATRVVLETVPDIVIVDIQLPGRDGFSLVDDLRAAGVPAALVLVSTLDAADYGSRIPAVGAAGFVPKRELTTAALLELARGPES